MTKREKNTVNDRTTGDGIEQLQKVINVHKPDTGRGTRCILIGVCTIFLLIMLVMPLIIVVINSLRDGWNAYKNAVLDEYTVSALVLTLEAMVFAVIVNTIFGVVASWLLSKFYFKGRSMIVALIDIPFSISPVLGGLIFILTYGNMGLLGDFLKNHGIKIVFAVPGIILVTIFVTMPLVFRELFPVMNATGKDEEEAAGLMGASGLTIFRKITFPHIKWALLYGIILCAARAIGEFGAVSAISGHLRGKTNTLSLHVEILYNEFNTTAAFAVSSILVLLAILMLILRNLIEWKRK